jgi:hypothetical protein
MYLCQRRLRYNGKVRKERTRLEGRYCSILASRYPVTRDNSTLRIHQIYVPAVHPHQMIRRNPTLIPMSDSDVQDVRDLVAKQKVDGERKQRAVARMKALADTPLKDMDMHVFNQLKELLEREKRLGMQKGASTSS